MKNRGFILTLDAALSVFIVLSILTYVSFVMNESEVTQWSEYQMLSAGYDTLSMLYNTGALERKNATEIEDAVNEVIPQNYGFRLEVASFTDAGGVLAESGSFTVGPAVADSAVVTHGKRTFLTYAGGAVESYNTAEFWIWLKSNTAP